MEITFDVIALIFIVTGTVQIVYGGSINTDDCRKCKAGYYVSRVCTEDLDTVCSPCPAHSFTDTTNSHSQCKPCSSCPLNSVSIAKCTRHKDTECILCDKYPKSLRHSMAYKRHCATSKDAMVGDEPAKTESHDEMKMGELILEEEGSGSESDISPDISDIELTFTTPYSTTVDTLADEGSGDEADLTISSDSIIEVETTTTTAAETTTTSATTTTTLATTTKEEALLTTTMTPVPSTTTKSTTNATLSTSTIVETTTLEKMDVPTPEDPLPLSTLPSIASPPSTSTLTTKPTMTTSTPTDSHISTTTASTTTTTLPQSYSTTSLHTTTEIESIIVPDEGSVLTEQNETESKVDVTLPQGGGAGIPDLTTPSSIVIESGEGFDIAADDKTTPKTKKEEEEEYNIIHLDTDTKSKLKKTRKGSLSHDEENTFEEDYLSQNVQGHTKARQQEEGKGGRSVTIIVVVSLAVVAAIVCFFVVLIGARYFRKKRRRSFNVMEKVDIHGNKSNGKSTLPMEFIDGERDTSAGIYDDIDGHSPNGKSGEPLLTSFAPPKEDTITATKNEDVYAVVDKSKKSGRGSPKIEEEFDRIKYIDETTDDEFGNRDDHRDSFLNAINESHESLKLNGHAPNGSVPHLDDDTQEDAKNPTSGGEDEPMLEDDSGTGPLETPDDKESEEENLDESSPMMNDGGSSDMNNSHSS